MGGGDDPATAVCDVLISNMGRAKVSVLDGGFRACVQVFQADGSLEQVSCSVLQCVVVCCSVLQCVVVCCSVLQSGVCASVSSRWLT